VRQSALRGLREPDSGFTRSAKTLRPLRSGYAVSLLGSDRLVTSKSGFEESGKPTAKMIKLVRDRINLAVRTKPPKGTKVALGAWHNPEDGKIEVNVTVVFPKNQRERAVAFAKEQNQVALFSLHEGEVVMTGGTGGKREVE
jgi:hypothetical protein